MTDKAARQPDDQAWLEALGDTSAGASHPDALLLREALKARADRLSRTVPVADAHLYEQLRFRMRREGLSSRFSQVKWLAAASFAAVAVAIALVLPASLWERDDTFSKIRGNDAAGVVDVSDPRAAAAQAAASFDGSGVKGRLREDGGSSVTLTVPASIEAIELAERLKLPSRRVGDSLEITFRKAAR